MVHVIVRNQPSTDQPKEVIMDWTLEVVVLPVTDIDRSIAFIEIRSASHWTATRSLRRCM